MPCNEQPEDTIFYISLGLLTSSALFRFFSFQSLIFVGTWNVNAKGIKDETLDDWICKDWGTDGRYAPDIVCVGFQEIVDLNAVNVAVDNKTQQKSQYWSDQLRQTLNNPRRMQQLQQDPQQQGYALIMQRSMVGLLVCLFVKAPHRHRCKAVTSDCK